MNPIPLRVFSTLLEDVAERKLASEMSIECAVVYAFMAIFTIFPLSIDIFLPTNIEGGILPRFGCLMVVISVLFASNLIRYKREEANVSDEISLLGIKDSLLDEVIQYFISMYKKSTTYGLDIKEEELDGKEKRLFEISNLYLWVAESRVNAKHYITLELVLAGYGSFLWGFGDLKIFSYISIAFSALLLFMSYDKFQHFRHLKAASKK